MMETFKDIKEINTILVRIKEYLVSIYKDKIRHVILYGSFARGKATEDSDVDILIVVDDSLYPRRVKEDLSELLFNILIEDGELVSVIVINEGMFENYRSPLLLNIKGEGMIV